MKKADLVRKMIAEAKSNGLSADDVISAVIADVGFQRQLARAYVNNNWGKVVVVETAKKALSMTKDAIRKREARARARAVAA